MTRKPRRGKKGSESCLGNQLSIIGHEGAALAQKSEILYEVCNIFSFFYNLNTIRLGIPVWYTNKITIIYFTIDTWLFHVKLKIVVDGPILHSISILDRPILHCKAKVCIFSKI